LVFVAFTPEVLLAVCVEEVFDVFAANEDALLVELTETEDKLVYALEVAFVEAAGVAAGASATTGGVVGSVPAAAAASVEFNASTGSIVGSSSSSSWSSSSP